MIYFVQSLDGGPVKIGTTEDLPARLAALESHYGTPLAVLATMPGGRDEERTIHERFANLRLGRTEQFRPGTDLMAFLGLPLFVSANPDAVEAMPTTMAGIRLKRIAATLDWVSWVEEGAEFCRTDVSKLIDVALASYLKTQGFLKPPPKRTP